MIDRSSFTDLYLVALYRAHRSDRYAMPTTSDLRHSYVLPDDDYLLSELPDMLEGRGWARVHRTHGPFDDWSIELSVHGREAAERLIATGTDVGVIGTPTVAKQMSEEVRSDGSLMGVSSEQDNLFVRLDQGEEAHQEISRHIDQLRHQLRGANDVGENGDERDRLTLSLDNASEFWNSACLKLVQVRVCVILAIEDVGQAFAKAGKSVSWELVKQLIVKYIKDKSGIEL